MTELNENSKGFSRDLGLYVSLGVLTNGLIHDLNNTLGALLGSSSLICVQARAENIEPEKMARSAEVIRKGVERISLLVQKLQGSSTLRDFVPENVNALMLYEEIQFLSERILGPKVTLVSSIENQNLRILAEPRVFPLVVVALLGALLREFVGASLSVEFGQLREGQRPAGGGAGGDLALRVQCMGVRLLDGDIDGVSIEASAKSHLPNGAITEIFKLLSDTLRVSKAVARLTQAKDSTKIEILFRSLES